MTASEQPPQNGGSRPVPDPTVLTDLAIAKAIDAMRDYVDGQFEVRDERLRGIDEATRLRLSGIVDFSPEIDTKLENVKSVTEEKFRSVDQRFGERDTRSERESRDNKVAVDAAFAAQKEAAAKQDEANAKAIDKSEKATAETIKTNQELNKATTDALTKSLDEVKLEVRGITATKLGANENRQVNTENRAGVYATIGLAITIVLFAIAVLGFIVSQATP